MSFETTTQFNAYFNLESVAEIVFEYQNIYQNCLFLSLFMKFYRGTGTRSEENFR